METKPLEPILVADLFPPMREALLALLRALSDAEWHLPTICEGWSVKDVALHMLGDDVGFLSRRRDAFSRPVDIDGWDNLIAFINAQNDLWVRATRRMSPRVLCDLLTVTGEMLSSHLETLDPFAAGDEVSWAGEGPAPVWLEIAREYTEHWMHQQHIRDAVGKPGLKTRRFFAPALGAFMYALPHTFRAVDAPPGTSIKLTITGEVGGAWRLVRTQEGWRLYRETDAPPACTVTVNAETVWRLFTKGISKEAARQRMRVEGHAALGAQVLETVAILA